MRMFRKLLCLIFGHAYEQVIDTEAKRAYQECWMCGHEFQYDFQKNLTEHWIGFMTGENCCVICLGWKPRAWKYCSSTYCEMNPKGHRSIRNFHEPD